MPRGDAFPTQHLGSGDSDLGEAVARQADGPARAQLGNGALHGQAAGIPEPPCQVTINGTNLHILVRHAITRRKPTRQKSVMQTIVDWDRDSPQWLAVLAASARGGGVGAAPAGNSIWPLYAPLAGVPRHQNFVIGQIGQSLDGRIATPTGHSHYINGKEAIIHLHRVRALVDAVVVGVGTVIADNPQLTVRHSALDGPQPARVVLDPRGRVPREARCFAADGARRILVRCSESPILRMDGIEDVAISGTGVDMSPQAVLDALHGLGLRRVLIEGGANTLSRFLAAKCIQRLHVMTAPLIIGSGPIGIQLPEIARLDQALRPEVTTFALPGGDILSDCAL